MSLGNDLKNHGILAVSYSAMVVVQATRAALDVLEKNDERPAIGLAVAGMLVRLHSEDTGDSIDQTIELMRAFVDNTQPDQTAQVKA